ncbi:unnamed protein product [Paramecium pentaurelia]|uniref:Uncharacterized protein n=1 Tax=Paramecium pentaurelia TaxID=43138 RepID=A0A8S1XTC0_9CILI|nr:unnamed protein product [Paramecium pentaurelia]
MVDTQYKVLKSISNEYNLKTENELEYFNYFMDVLIKQNPYDNQNTENKNIFQLFQRELQENEQFISINNNNRQNQSYLDIFHQKIQQILEKSKDQLIDMKQFYSQQIQYSIITKVDIQEYLNSQFEQDFDQFLRKYENHTNIGAHFYNFLSFLDYLQISYHKKSKQQLDNIINNYSNQQQIKQLFINKREQPYQAFNKLKKSLHSDYNANQEIDLSGTTFGQTFMNTYQGLKISQTKDESWNNTQSFKKELLQKNIIIKTQNDIFTSQNTYQESFNFIMSPQSSFPVYFRSKFPKQFNTIMINLKGWNKLYNELYNLIQQEMIFQKRKVNNNKEDEYIQSFNPYLITGIMKKVENSIKVKYNNYFAQFGVILTDVGERCIYYYSMLIIWRFLCYQRQNSKNIQQKHQKNYQNELNRCIAEINQDNQKQSCIKAKELVNKIQKSLKKQYLDIIKKEVLQNINKISMSNFQLVEKLDKELLIDVDEKTFEDQQYQLKILSYTTDHKSYINKYVQDMLAQFQLELFDEYSNKYRQELSQYLKCIVNKINLLQYSNQIIYIIFAIFTDTIQTRIIIHY